MPSSAPTYDYSHLIGKRVSLSGVGENEIFEKNLPRTATVVRQIALGDWGPDWLVIRLDESFEYEGISIRDCIVRGRWEGHPIGSEFCPVFVLVDRRDMLSAKHQWSSADFLHVTWGEIELE
jgi:hypothetical protein